VAANWQVNQNITRSTSRRVRTSHADHPALAADERRGQPRSGHRPVPAPGDREPLDLRTARAATADRPATPASCGSCSARSKPRTDLSAVAFTVILEYGVPIQAASRRSWAQQWMNRTGSRSGRRPTMPPAGDHDQVVLRTRRPASPTGAVNQLRTTRFAWGRALGAPPQPDDTGLASCTNTGFQTPDPSGSIAGGPVFWSGSTLLRSFSATNPAGTTVPLCILRDPSYGRRGARSDVSNVGYFLEHRATLDLDPTTWGTGTPATPSTSRLEHGAREMPRGEDRTPFQHMHPTQPLGSARRAVRFLTGIPSAIPAFGAPERTFTTLARRAVGSGGRRQLGMLAFRRAPGVVQKALEVDRCRRAGVTAGGAGRGAGDVSLLEISSRPRPGSLSRGSIIEALARTSA